MQIAAGAIVDGIVAADMDGAFYFCTGFGQYTGLLATSFEGFVDALERAPVESSEFHVRRRDYERWTRDVLGSKELADRIEDLRRMDVTGEELRRGLIGVTKKLADLESQKRYAIRYVPPSYA